MKKMTQLLETNSDGLFEVKVELTLTVEAANEGEVSYLVEENLSSLQMKNEFVISDIQRISNLEKK